MALARANRANSIWFREYSTTGTDNFPPKHVVPAFPRYIHGVAKTVKYQNTLNFLVKTYFVLVALKLVYNGYQ